MKLQILERITLQGLIPVEGNYITYGLIKQMRTELSFTEKEIKDCKIIQTGDRITWDDKKDKPKEIEIPETVLSMIVLALEKLEKEEKLNDNNISLYEKFIVSKK